MAISDKGLEGRGLDPGLNYHSNFKSSLEGPISYRICWCIDHFSSFLESGASHGPGMSLGHSVGHSLIHTLTDLCSVKSYTVLYSLVWSCMVPYGLL